MKRTLLLLLCVVLAVGATYTITTRHYRVGYFAENNIRDGNVQAADGVTWAQPLDLHGVPNLYQVSPDLYRGAQPEREGLVNLGKLGVKTVVNLREDHDDTALADGTGLDLRRIPLNAMRRPTDQEVVEFLKLFAQPRSLPVFVHCQRGADRTGLMCAVYRVAVQGWSRQAAIDEMTRGGFGYFLGFERLAKYVETADFERLKREAGLAASQPATAPPVNP